MSPFDGAVDRLNAAAAELRSLRPALEAGSPWPLAERFGTEPEAAWGPPETLAHLGEMLPFWLGEIERVLAGSPAPVPFGRVVTDQVRLVVIERDRTVPVRELLDRIESDVDRYARRLPELSEVDAARLGLHPARGPMAVSEMLERFVVGHLEEHLRQLRELLGSGA